MAWGNLSENRTQFYQAYGAAMAQWVGIEQAFGRLFVRYSGMQEEVGLDVFFSARSFLGRVEMLTACFPHLRDVPVAKTFLVDLVIRARTWSSLRNSMAHDGHAVIFQKGREDPFHAISPRPGGTLEAHEIARAADNFFVLNQLAHHCMGRSRPVREPELCAELLSQLPTDARSDGGGYSRAGPLLTRIQSCAD